MKHDSDILKRIKNYFMRRKSAKEAHSFEREAEKDAFLYEAMEGLEGMLTSDIQQALDELDYMLDDKLKGVAWYQNWRVAASIILILGLGSTLYFLIPGGETESEPEYSMEEGKSEYIPRLKTPEYDSFEAEFATTDSLSSAAFEDELEETMANAEVVSNNAASAEEDAVDSRFDEIVMSGYATSQGEPNIEEEMADTESDVEEVLDASSDDLVMEQESYALSDERRSLSTPPASNQTPEETSDYLENVSNKVSKSRAKAETSSANEVVPADGMKAYRAYLSKNLRASEGMPSGSVGLSFEVDRNGRPKKIQVVKTLCTACDAEAIRLLINGPKWKSASKKARGSISISFP